MEGKIAQKGKVPGVLWKKLWKDGYLKYMFIVKLIMVSCLNYLQRRPWLLRDPAIQNP